MAKVVLKRNWFAPDNILYIRDEGGTEVPDMFGDKKVEDVLPSDAKVVDDDYMPPRKKDAKPAANTLSGLSKEKYGSSK